MIPYITKDLVQFRTVVIRPLLGTFIVILILEANGEHIAV